MIIILSRQDDKPHTELVTKRLAEHDKSFLLLDTTALHRQQVSIGEGNSGWILEVDTTNISPDDISSVWVRRPFRQVGINEPALAHHMQAEYKTFTEGMLGLFAKKGIFILNDLHVCDVAANKLVQWDAFRRLDIPSPATRFSNKLAKVRASQTVVKQLAHKSVSAEPKDYILPTKILGAHELNTLRHHSMPPLLLQNLVDIQYEIRVTVVDKNIFAARIDYNAHDTVDYRQLFGTAGVSISSHTLPKASKDKCLRIMDHFGLHFGCIDIAVDHKGEHWFLEINPNGQWGWIEQATGQPISAAIANILAAPPRA